MTLCYLILITAGVKSERILAPKVINCCDSNALIEKLPLLRTCFTAHSINYTLTREQSTKLFNTPLLPAVEMTTIANPTTSRAKKHCSIFTQDLLLKALPLAKLYSLPLQLPFSHYVVRISEVTALNS